MVGDRGIELMLSSAVEDSTRAPRFSTVFATMEQPFSLKGVGDRQLTGCCVGSDDALRISGSPFVMRSMIYVFGRRFFMPDTG